MSQTFLKSQTEPSYSFTPPAVRLTENQRKIISEKYLKDDPTVEVWLRRVALNIALAELLYHPDSSHWKLFDGVRLFKKETPAPEGSDLPPTRSWLFHANLQSALERDSNFKRFLDNCHKWMSQNEEARNLVEPWAERYYELLSSWRFLPNSPTLMNAGRDIQQLSACYVLPVEDSIEDITNALRAQALIHKSGGGTGFSFEKIRPAGDPVKSTSGAASGVVSFMKVFDKMTEVVKQGGNRRGANMAVLPYWHSEIRDFINLKSRPGVMENFNISVAVDDRFMEAVTNGWEYDLINPRTQEKTGRVNAKAIFSSIIENAWKSGDPGIIFIDRINHSKSNPTPDLGKILATNPCGEQPLLPNEPCNLGSINLSGFVLESHTIDWAKLEETIFTSIRFLDDVIDVNNYPLPEIEVMAKGNRRIGLGVMGWAEMLVRLGIPYDSEAAIEKAKELMGFINKKALEASEKLAIERGAFPNWKNSVYDVNSHHFAAENAKPRHAARTTIAPTGTIGLAAGLQGAGIEPFYGIAYTRYNAKAIDRLKKGLVPEEKDSYFEVNPLFKEIAEKENYFGLGETELWRKIEINHKSIRGILEIPENIQKLFPTAHEVTIDFHVKMQAAFQSETDNAVSKTINMPHSATLQDVADAYLMAHRLGCKGITIYRDGSKQQQVLNHNPTTAKPKRAHDFTAGVKSEYYEIKTGHGPLHIHIDFDEGGPFRVSASLEPAGTEIAGLAGVTGNLITQFLEQGGNPNKLLKGLSSVKGDRPHGAGDNKVNSLSHAIGIALGNHLKKHGWLENVSEPALNTDDGVNLELWNLAQSASQCPRCFSSNITVNAGCSGPLCLDCGYSECS